MKIYILLLISLHLFLFACMPEDSPVKPFDRGNSIIQQIALDKDSKWQVFFSLNDNKEVKRSEMTDWDVAFNCSDTSNTIMLNMATFMSLQNLGQVAFETVPNTKGVIWIGENPYGYKEIDSSAIGKWYSDSIGKIESKNDLYLINRGYNSIGKPLGYKKMMILGADKLGFDIKVADLNGSNERNIRINKNPNLNYICLSFSDFEIKEIEPDNDEWDLLFTKYTYIYHDPEYIPYAVTGVLLNPKYVEVAIDTVNKYEDISSELIEQYTFNNKYDIIGFEWKRYDLDNSIYYVYPWRNYIIKDRLGFYYKLHFIDYYDQSGERGAPKFEFQKL